MLDYWEAKYMGTVMKVHYENKTPNKSMVIFSFFYKMKEHQSASSTGVI
jgi:hypothetical protein